MLALSPSSNTLSLNVRPCLSKAPHSKLHRSPSLTLLLEKAHDQHWLRAGSSQFARVVKGVGLRSTARKCAWVSPPLSFECGAALLRQEKNPIADMSGARESL